MPTPNRWIRRAARLVVVVALLEGSSYVALRLGGLLLTEEVRTGRSIIQEQSERIRRLIRPDSSSLLVLDPVLGWRYRSGHRDSLNQVNLAGLRSVRDYVTRPPDKVTRVAVFGDSFVYGTEVGNEDAWPRVMEVRFPTVEVLNYGVGGYGNDQAYLRFLSEGATFSPHIVVLCFTPDDLTRLINVFRPFRSHRELPLTKPRYLLSGGNRLLFLPAPAGSARDYARYLVEPRRILELGVADDWYEPLIYENPLHDYSATFRLLTTVWVRATRRLAQDRLVREGAFNPRSTAFRIQTQIFRAFSDSAQRRGARPLIVFLPEISSVRNARSGRPTVYASLANWLLQNGLDFLDATDTFRFENAIDRWFMPGGHYSPEANRLVAQWLGGRITRMK